MKNLMGELLIMKTYSIKPNFSALSREYGLDRHTIKKYYEEGGIKRKKMERERFFDKYRDEIIELLSKPHVSVKGAYEYLVHKYGEEVITGTYNNLRHYCWYEGLRSTYKHNAHVRYETPPGKQLQNDWKEDMVIHTSSGEEIMFNLLSSTLGYSRFHQLIYSETKTTEAYIRCTVETLKRLGGLPKEILTDNMSAVVNHNTGEKLPAIKQFENDLGIKINLCKIRTPETKGKDESANRYASWLYAYDYKIKDKKELIEAIEYINQRINQETNQTTNIPPVRLFQKEKEYLDPLPNKILMDDYQCQTLTKVVPPTLLVNYNGSGYSVPRIALGKRVKIVPEDDKLYIYLNTDLISVHTITSQKFNYEEEHYKSALASRMSSKTEEEIEKMAKENLQLLSHLKGRIDDDELQ